MHAVKVIRKQSPARSENRQKETNPVISHGSVLILSGVLIGMVFCRIADPRFETVVFAAGLIGIVSFLGLDWWSRQRRQQAARVEREQASHNLERRIDRHIPAEAYIRSSRRMPLRIRTRRGYQPVVKSTGYRYRYP